MEQNKYKYILLAFVFFALFAGYLARTLGVSEDEKRYFNYEDDDGERTMAKHRPSGPFGQGSRTLKGRNKKSHWDDFSSVGAILEDAEKESEEVQMAKLQEHMDDVGDDVYVDVDIDGKYVEGDGNRYPPVERSLSSLNSDWKMRAMLKKPKKPIARRVHNRIKDKPNYVDYDEPPRDLYEDRFLYGP
ncbi:hypothetical protein AWZ03_012900 [Drosophila navojoa]|uniref:Uncharacterized protein n=1 Tax=Drosophila navojoa TaxID=7232 RepID=A0A484AXF7_DRONA|nr:hypothetical protein AWZ03_012900 [Drosophila navojoa]